MEPDEAFTVLGLPINASAAEIQERFRKLALERHPDRGGDHGDMAQLNNARDVALNFATRDKSLTVREVMDVLTGVSSQNLKHQRRKDHVEHIRRSVIDRNIAPMQRARQAAIVFGGVAGVAAFLSTQLSQNVNAVMAVVPLASVSAACAVGALVAHYKADRIKGLVETFVYELEDKSLLANLIREAQSHTCTPNFTQDSLQQALESWLNTGSVLGRLVPRNIGEVIMMLGPHDAARLMIAKGLETAILLELEAEGEDGQFQITYSLRRPSPESPAGATP
jgi:phospholipid N-methyltransferase